MPATSEPPTTDPPSSTSKAKAARTAACPSRPNCYRSSRYTSPVEQSASPTLQGAKRTSRALLYRRWPARSPLFVGRDGERITRGTLQSRIKRAFKRSGPLHGLRHTYATELASSDFSVYTLMKLLGHESMTTSKGRRQIVVRQVAVRRDATRHCRLVRDQTSPALVLHTWRY